MSTLLTAKAANWYQKQCVGVRNKPIEIYVLTTVVGFFVSLKTKQTKNPTVL